MTFIVISIDIDLYGEKKMIVIIIVIIFFLHIAQLYLHPWHQAPLLFPTRSEQCTANPEAAVNGPAWWD